MFSQTAGFSQHPLSRAALAPRLFPGLLMLWLLLCPAAPAAAQTASPTPTPDVPALEARLFATPILYQMTTDEVRAIYSTGAALGNDPHVFALIGDSNTTNGDFMQPLGLEPLPCDFGAHEELRETVAYYAVPVQDARSSFTRDHVTADRGMNSFSVLDPFWATDPLCASGETPLACEYRLTQPAAAIILLGQIDINYGGGSLDLFRASMTEIVEYSIAHGVIPVLTTIVFLPSRNVYGLSLQFNGVLLDLADEYGIPLINMWRAVRDGNLPDYGIGPDRSHLRAAVGHYCDFAGGEAEYGGTLRNLLTLEALDALRLEVYG